LLCARFAAFSPRKPTLGFREQLRASLRRKEGSYFLAYPAFSLRSVSDKSQTYQPVIGRKRASGRAGLTCRRAYGVSSLLPLQCRLPCVSPWSCSDTRLSVDAESFVMKTIRCSAANGVDSHPSQSGEGWGTHIIVS
jgi:hypothetical protein